MKMTPFGPVKPGKPGALYRAKSGKTGGAMPMAVSPPPVTPRQRGGVFGGLGGPRTGEFLRVLSAGLADMDGTMGSGNLQSALAREQAARQGQRADQYNRKQDARAEMRYQDQLQYGRKQDARSMAMQADALRYGRKQDAQSMAMTREQMAQQQANADRAFGLDEQALALRAQAANQPSAPPAPPAGIQELQFRAQAAGLQPGTPEYQQFMLNDGRPAEESSGSTLLAPGVAGMGTGAQNFIVKQEEQTLDRAAEELARLENIENMTKQFLTSAEGYGAQGGGVFNDIGQALSMTTSDLKSITNQLAPLMRQPGSGTMSDADMRAFAESTVNINNTRETNERIAANAAAVAGFQRDYITSARKWQYENGIGSLRDFERLWDQYKEMEPVFDRETGMASDARLSFDEWFEDYTAVMGGTQ